MNTLKKGKSQNAREKSKYIHMREERGLFMYIVNNLEVTEIKN